MPDLYGKIVEGALYPLWERRIRRRPILDYLAELRHSERWTRDELELLQLERLRLLLQHAGQNVPYYRDALRVAGVDPEEVRCLADLRALPVLDRQSARRSAETRRSTGGPAIAVVKTTGGTTGEPLVIEYDAESEHRRQAMRLRGFGWAGYHVGKPAVHYWGAATAPNLSWKQRLKVSVDRAIKRETYFDCSERSEDSRRQVAAWMRRHQPEVLFCYAQAGADLARTINRDGLRDWKSISVICGAERLLPADREQMETAFGDQVYETYGCREVMLIATECAHHEGLHLSSEHLIVELVDDDGEPVAPGQPGRVLVTDLFNYGAPLIRYENGDQAVAMPADAPCACGRRHPRLASIDGRVTETLRDGRGNLVGGMVFNLIFSPLAREVDQFQVVQHRDASITVRAVSRAELSARAREHFAAQAARYLPGVPVVIERVPDIPPSKNGKRKVVIVE